MPKKINDWNEVCRKCNQNTVPLIGVLRYCPVCEGDEQFNSNDPYGFKIIDLPEIGSPFDRDEVTVPITGPLHGYKK